MVCIYSYLYNRANIPDFCRKKLPWFLNMQKACELGQWPQFTLLIYITIVHCNKLSRFWFSQLSHKYQVRFATNIRSCGSQTARKPLAEMIALINWSAMALLLVKRGGGEIWQSISGKPIANQFFLEATRSDHSSSKSTRDEPSSVLQLSNLSTYVSDNMHVKKKYYFFLSKLQR